VRDLTSDVTISRTMLASSLLAMIGLRDAGKAEKPERRMAQEQRV
jgi:hypothetical protein